MPGPERNRKGLKQTVRSMPRLFVALAKNAGPTVVPDECPDFRPGVLASYEGKGAILSKVTGENMVMQVL